jgi:hypothetical protein
LALFGRSTGVQASAWLAWGQRTRKLPQLEEAPLTRTSPGRPMSAHAGDPRLAMSEPTRGTAARLRRYDWYKASDSNLKETAQRTAPANAQRQNFGACGLKMTRPSPFNPEHNDDVHNESCSNA